jgi:TPR repeat protein
MKLLIIRTLINTLFAAAVILWASVPAKAQEAYSPKTLNYYYQQCRGLNPGWLLDGARGGDQLKQFCVACNYAVGRGVPKNPSLSVEYMRRAADSGFAPAQDALGEEYRAGEGVPKDLVEAVRLFRKSASQGFADAQARLGEAYWLGQGVQQDRTEGTKWLRLGASNGSTEAIGFLRSIENPKPTRNEPAQDLFEEGSRLYNSGHQAEAARPFLKAAEAGNSLAQLQIGWHYEKGVGVSQSFAQAADWYRKAAGNGNTAAMKNLGQLYELGQGVPENWVEAAKWYRTSAERGDPNGEAALARAYEFGVGVYQSRQQAIEWDQRAAAQGNAQSAYYARWLQSGSNSIGFRNQEERNMFRLPA